MLKEFFMYKDHHQGIESSQMALWRDFENTNNVWHGIMKILI